MQKKVSVSVLAVAVLMSMSGGLIAGAVLSPKQKQVEAISPKITLTMHDGRGRVETRTYDLTAMTYTSGQLKTTLVNPTLYRCGFEP